MKLKTLFIAALSLASTAISQAFTLDFNDTTVSNAGTKVGQTISSGNPITVTVYGYGEVTFSSDDTLTIGPTYTNGLSVNSIEFPVDGYSLTVTFAGDVDTFNVSALGQDTGEGFSVSGALPGNVHTITATVNDGIVPVGLGIQAITFTGEPVPEPSSVILGIIGMAAILLRRGR